MIMTTLEEKVRNILDGSDFNDLPLQQQKKAIKSIEKSEDGAD